MPVTLLPLPYAMSALEPGIGPETLRKHHGAHHKGYVDKVNALTAGTDLADEPLEAIVAAARSEGDAALFNQAAQVWNHGFYWLSLTPHDEPPTGELAAAIDDSFGSLAALQEKLAEAAIGHFGSGWAWLVSRGGTLSVETTHDAETFADSADAVPLLVIDVWEHAYYLDHQNARKAYVEAVVKTLLDWSFAAANFARAAVWTYPA